MIDQGASRLPVGQKDAACNLQIHKIALQLTRQQNHGMHRSLIRTG